MTRMIARLWRGATATAAKADAYQQHVTGKVFPALAAIKGFVGARVLRREEGGRVEFLVITEWESMEAIRRFAGERPELAVVEPEAREALSDYDGLVRHYEIVHEVRR